MMAGTHDTLPATKKPRCRTHFLCTLPIIISFCLADRGLTEGRVRDHTSILQRFPAGEQLAIASHGCTVQFVSGLHKALASSGAAESQQRQLLRLEQLPLRCVEHLSETTLVGAGFDGEVCPEESPQNPSHAVPPPSEHPLVDAVTKVTSPEVARDAGALHAKSRHVLSFEPATHQSKQESLLKPKQEMQ